MSDEEIIRKWHDELPAEVKTDEADLVASMPWLSRLVRLAIAQEREACMQVAIDAEHRKWDAMRTGGKLEGFSAADIAAAIRERGEE